MKQQLDKYYTPKEVVDFCYNKVKDIIGYENITEIIEPSAGNGSFLLDDKIIAYDIEPDNEKIIKQDFLKLDIPYKKGRLILGNPPYGNCLNLAQKFYKHSISICDYIAFILPISQLNNTQSLYEFDLVSSSDLGLKIYTDRELHCCFNIYKRPIGELNKKQINTLKDVEIVRQDSKKYSDFDYDIRMCYWGNGTSGKILKEGEHYSGEFKIKIHNKEKYEKIKNFIETFDWKNYVNCIAMKKIQKFHIINKLKEEFPDLN